jgi:hypothetical protein
MTIDGQISGPKYRFVNQSNSRQLIEILGKGFPSFAKQDFAAMIFT